MDLFAFAEEISEKEDKKIPEQNSQQELVQGNLFDF